MTSPPPAPLWVLQPSTVSLLSVQLKEQKLLTSKEGHLRDWRGVAELSGMANNHHLYTKIKNSQEPFAEIFSYWKKLPEANVRDLWDILEHIDRFDVRDDSAEKILVDIKIAETTAAKKGLELKNLKALETNTGEEALTMEDLDCLNSGKPLPVYDAFILYGEEDQDVVSDIVTNLEAQGLKILLKDRDLLGGTFEHAAVMKLISSRCTKLVPLFSTSFFSSEYNTFLANFAQHLSLENPGKMTAKIIPIVSDQRCDIPANLAMYSKLKFDPNNKLFNFWERLVRTINPAVKFNPMNTPNSETQDQNKNQTMTSKLVLTPQIVSKSVKSKDAPAKQEFSNIAFNGNSSSEPSSLESEVTGDSGALLLPDVPDHVPGGLVGWVKSKLPLKKSKKAKTRYKQKSDAESSAC